MGFRGLLAWALDLGLLRSVIRSVDRPPWWAPRPSDLESAVRRWTGRACDGEWSGLAHRQLAPHGRRDVLRAVRSCVFHSRARLRPGSAPGDHWHHTDRRLRQHDRLASYGMAGGLLRVASDPLCMGGRSPPNMPSTQPGPTAG